LVLAATSGNVAAQVFCDDPPLVTVLTGEPVTVSSLESEGHPIATSWYVTPPGGLVPTKPTADTPLHTFSPNLPGLWSVGLIEDYEHSATGGGLWSSEDCITVAAASVVASIGLSAVQIATDEAFDLDGFGSQWAVGVVPLVEWQIDGQAYGPCNGGPPPASPAELSCAVPGNLLSPGWHTAGLELTDPSSGDTSLAVGDFEVIEIIPLSVDFSWSPTEPDPNVLVLFTAAVTPATSEQDFTRVVWDLGDGFVQTFTSCPPPFFNTCLQYPYSFGEDGWYEVSVTVETAEESASQTYSVKIGDPVDPPVASIQPTPSSPQIHEVTSLAFDGSCSGQCEWVWDFGDGGVSTLENPTHTWFVPDTYTVSLTVSNEGGSDSVTLPIGVTSCWSPATPTQQGVCYGGQVTLTAATGNAWLWNTGETGPVIASLFAGGYWVNVDDGAGCWGHSPATVVLNNCGDPGGDTNLDGAVDAADLAALVPELTDGDGDTVIGAGGGDLTAPGGDVTGDFRLRADDLLTVQLELFD